METEFIYYRHTTPIGVVVDEVCGCEQKNGKIWLTLAKQIYSENGHDGYRAIGHYDSGVPLLEDEPIRISVSHTNHLLVVASLAKTPEVNLEQYNERAALGIDTEAVDRQQVLSIRERFLSEKELAMIEADNLEANILAWTAKEALYKAALCPGLDFRKQIHITTLPCTATGTTGIGSVTNHEGIEYEFQLYSYISEGCVVTIAISPKSATFKKNKR